jgi:hypothetical protein
MAHKPIKMDKSWSLYSLFSMLLGKSCSIKNVDMGTHNRPRKKHTTLKTFLAFSGNKINLILFRILFLFNTVSTILLQQLRSREKLKV